MKGAREMSPAQNCASFALFPDEWSVTVFPQSSGAAFIN